MKFGLNLYSVRSRIQDEESFLETALALKKMGYSYLQYSGAAYDAGRIKRVSETAGMPIVLTHVPLPLILDETEKTLQEHLSFGCRNIGLGMMPLEILLDEKKCLETIRRLDEVGARMEDLGGNLYYHFHHFEFKKMDNGQRPIDYMIEHCPHIHFTADIYWIQYGGGDVCDYLRRMKGRVGCIHLKDYRIEIKENGEFVPRFAALGEGNLDLGKIIEAAKEAGTEYFLVEQDDAETHPDPMEQLRLSADYLKSL